MKLSAYCRTFNWLLAAALVSVALSAYAAAPESKVMVPSTVPGIWQAIDQEMASLEQAITSKQLATVHEHAYAVRDLVTALVDREKDVSAEDRQTLVSDSRFVATLASRLDQSGDSGDQAGAQSNYSKLKTIIASIRELAKPKGGIQP